ncbi:DNA polymerase III subunit gamma/tau [Candidatus Vidania fulgoroideorum]
MDLYNKYIPKNIKSFFGQKYIVKIVKYFKKRKEFPSSIIFYGKKGTGKTSFSKIFFNYINCLNHNDICNKCVYCKNIKKNSVDYKEIDAASNSKVEEIKIIMNNFNYYPIYVKYRVIVIDEAQMLSIYSFNYLLKLIENLNKFSVLIFITTNIKKIPDTIKSRCFIFNFKKFSKIDIIKFLILISKKEKIKISNRSLEIISINSEGSLRDSLVLLQHSYILSNCKTIKYKIFEKILDIPKKKHLVNFVKYLLYDNKKIDYLIKKIIDNKTNIKIFFNKLFELCCFLLLKYNNKNLNFKNSYYEKIDLTLKKKDLYKIKVICDTVRKEMVFLKGFSNDYLLMKYMVFLISYNMPNTGLEPVC